MRLNIHWPAEPSGFSVYSPWYVILWRVLWSPVLFTGFALMFLGIFGAFGLERAMDFKRDNFG